MKTKIVYVLTSDETDLYLEQNLISVYSCRLHNPDATIILVTDQFTHDTCRSGMRKDFLEYFDEVKVVDSSAYENNMKRSRLLKTTLRKIIYGDYLFIDTDTVICESLADIDNIKSPMALVPDMHMSVEQMKEFHTAKFVKNFIGGFKTDRYFNSGVAYVKDVPETHELYRLWYEEWHEAQKNGMNVDQPPFHRAWAKAGTEIETLDGIWNCQIAVNGLKYLYNSKIIHLYATHEADCPHKLHEKETLESIKTQQKLSDEIINNIKHPKEAFNDISILASEATLAKSFLKVSNLALLLKKNAKFLYGFLSLQCSLLVRIYLLNQKIKRK